MPVGVEPDVDLALPTAEDEHLADAVHALELAAQDLVGVLGDFARPACSARQRDAETGAASGSKLVDARLLDRLRQPRQHAVDLVAHFLRGHVAVLLEHERDDDDARRLPTRWSAARRCR